MFEAMVSSWNRQRFRLHFVTAREMYNIIKAAEEGREGNPNLYRDHVLPPPANRRIFCEQPWQLYSYGSDRIALDVNQPRSGTIEFSREPLRRVSGTIKKLEVFLNQGKLARLEINGEGEYEVQLVEHHLMSPDFAFIPGDRIHLLGCSAS
jgi:hypothetical protein